MDNAKYYVNQMPRWMLVWFYLTAIICSLDATFVVFRPHTLPGGKLFNFFYPYKYYISVDQRYQDPTDSYAFTQSLLNYAEVILDMITIYFHYKKSAQTKPLAFTVSVMTFWKSVLYIAMFYELAGGKDFRAGNTLIAEILMVLIPNGIWIVLPLTCIVTLWHSFIRLTSAAKHSN